MQLNYTNGIVMDGGLVLHDGVTMLPNTKWGSWFGDVGVVIPETKNEDLKLEWTGKEIPLELFRKILSFFKWSYDTLGCEAQVRLYYNPSSGEWDAVAMPQFITAGLQSDENDKHPDFDRLKLEMEKNGYGHMGSGHHHCAAGAHQSPRDYKDEIVTEGFHFTVGNMNRKEASFHSRCVVRKVCYNGSVSDAFLPSPLYNSEALLLSNLPEPDDTWKDRMIVQKPKPVVKRVAQLHPGSVSDQDAVTEKVSWFSWALQAFKKKNSKYTGVIKPESDASMPVMDLLPATDYTPDTYKEDYDDYASYIEDDLCTFYGVNGDDDYFSTLFPVTSQGDVSRDTVDNLKELLSLIDQSVGLEVLTPELCEALADISYNNN